MEHNAKLAMKIANHALEIPQIIVYLVQNH